MKNTIRNQLINISNDSRKSCSNPFQ